MNPVEQHKSSKQILTFVVEDYFQVGAFNAVIPRSHWHRFDTRLEANTQTLLDLLDENGDRATFFCCGWVADNYPGLLRSIVERGHEVACQTYYPTPVKEFQPQSLAHELARTRDAIAAATGYEALGFRVGRGWLPANATWVLESLAAAGFAYDSSMTELGWVSSAQSRPAELHRRTTSAGDIWEVPVSSVRFAGLALPISGGNYIRQIPWRISNRLIHGWVDRHEQPLVAYFHAWEIDSLQPNIDAAPWLQRIRHYRNLGDMREIIRYYLDYYRFTSIADYLNLPAQAAARSSVASSKVYSASVPRNTARTEITVAIPCYNEEATLPYLQKTLQQFSDTFAARYDTHFLFVDDGSRDRTWERLESYFGSRDDCSLVQHPSNRGIAAGILTAIEAADTELVTILDADCSFDPLQLPKLMALMDENIDMVAASPLHRDGEMVNVPGWRLLMSRGAALLYRWVLHHKFASYTSCFRVYRRSSVLPMRLMNEGFGGVTEILARMDLAGARIVECPAVLESRLLGQSKINTLRTVGEHLRLIARIARARIAGTALPEPARER